MDAPCLRLRNTHKKLSLNKEFQSAAVERRMETVIHQKEVIFISVSKVRSQDLGRMLFSYGTRQKSSKHHVDQGCRCCVGSLSSNNKRNSTTPPPANDG